MTDSSDGPGTRATRISSLCDAFVKEPTLERAVGVAEEIERVTGLTTLRSDMIAAVEQRAELLALITAIERAEHVEKLVDVDLAVEELSIRAETAIEVELSRSRAEIRKNVRLDHLRMKAKIARERNEFVERHTEMARLGRELNVPNFEDTALSPQWSESVDRLLSAIELNRLRKNAKIEAGFLRKQARQRVWRRVVEHYPWVLASIIGLVLLPEVLFDRAEPWVLGAVLLPVLLWLIQEVVLNRLFEAWRFRRHCSRLREQTKSACGARLQSLLHVGLVACGRHSGTAQGPNEPELTVDPA